EVSDVVGRRLAIFVWKAEHFESRASPLVWRLQLVVKGCRSIRIVLIESHQLGHIGVGGRTFEFARAGWALLVAVESNCSPSIAQGLVGFDVFEVGINQLVAFLSGEGEGVVRSCDSRWL